MPLPHTRPGPRVLTPTTRRSLLDFLFGIELRPAAATRLHQPIRIAFYSTASFHAPISVVLGLLLANQPNAAARLEQESFTSRLKPLSHGFTGILLASKAVVLSAPFDGTVASFPAYVGQSIRANETVAEIRSSTVNQTSLRIAEAQLAQARANEMLSAIEYQRAVSRQSRLLALSRDGLISSQQLEEAEFDTQLANAQKHGAEAAVQYASAVAARDAAAVQDLSVRAPFAGVISFHLVSVGQHVTRGTPLVRVVRVEPLRVRFSVPASERTGLSPGSEISIAIPEHRLFLPGRIQAVAIEADGATQTYIVEGVVTGRLTAIAPSLLVGRAVSVTIQQLRK
jgi:RND family efflux transporter MFP subunit